MTAAWVGTEWHVLNRGKCRRYVVNRSVTKESSVTQVECAELGTAEPSCVRQDGLEYGLQLAGRTRDNAQDLRGGGLLLQRFTQLVEQAGILNGDDGLRGEVLDQLDLLVRERPDFLPVDDNAADQLVVLEHGHGDI